MINIFLEEHLAENWYTNQNTYFRGWFFYEGLMYYGEKIKDIDFGNSEIGFKIKIQKFNGNFAIIHKTEEKTFIAVDRIMSFPILYAINDNTFIVNDNIEKILQYKNIKQTDFFCTQEFIATGFVSGNKTLYKDIFMLEAGQYLIVDNHSGKYEVKDYFLHSHSNYYDLSEEQLCKLHDSIVLNVFKRMLESIQGKTIVLFLSGGYDSRLVAVTLKKLNYKKIICVSFGNKNNKEVIVAKSIADELGYKWIRIDNPKRLISEIQITEKFRNFVYKASNGYVLPYMQGLLCYKLVEEGIIPKNSVFVTGNSGDVIEGDQFSDKFQESKKYTKDDIINAIIEKHYMEFGYRFSQKKCFRDFISELIPTKKEYTYEECQDLYEFFNWRQRQAKYVVSDVRCYDDFLGMEWRLPLWDNELVDFWLKVPTHLRKNRKLYYQCVREENYPTANKVTSFMKVAKYLKRNAHWLVKILYPIRKIWVYLREDDQIYLTDTKGFFTLLYLTKGYRMETITTRIYYILTNYYNKYIESFQNYIRK